jgi:hypothetical protein
MRAFAIACFVATTISAAPASAQLLTEVQERNAIDRSIATAPPPVQRTSTTPLLPLAPKQRPAVLLPLYASYAALQMSDAALTTRALGLGGREANGLMAGIARHPLALYSLKAAIVGASVFQSEKMWRNGKRKSAIATLVVVNAMYIFVVNHNRQVINNMSR